MIPLQEVRVLDNYKLSEGNEESPLPPGAIGILEFDIIQEGDRVNGNGRVYPWGLLKETCRRHLEDRVKRRQSVSGQAHLENMKFSDIGAVLVDYKIDESSRTIGPAKFLIPDTDAGRNVRAVARLGVPIGSSSIGSGSVKSGEYTGAYGTVKGSIIQEDYKVSGWDLVIDPSVSAARSTKFTEGTQTMTDKTYKSFNDFKTDEPALAAELIQMLKSDLQESLIEMQKTYENEIRLELQESFETEKSALLEQIASLTTSRDQLSEKVKTLSESTSNDLELQTEQRISEVRATLTAELKSVKEAAEKSIAEERAIRESREAVSFLYEKLNVHPLRETLLMLTMGPQSKSNPTGISATKEDLAAFGHIVAPKNVAEAQSRLNQVIATAKAMGNGKSTQRGVDQNESKELSASEQRLVEMMRW